MNNYFETPKVHKNTKTANTVKVIFPNRCLWLNPGPNLRVAYQHARELLRGLSTRTRRISYFGADRYQEAITLLLGTPNHQPSTATVRSWRTYLKFNFWLNLMHRLTNKMKAMLLGSTQLDLVIWVVLPRDPLQLHAVEERVWSSAFGWTFGWCRCWRNQGNAFK